MEAREIRAAEQEIAARIAEGQTEQEIIGRNAKSPTPLTEAERREREMRYEGWRGREGLFAVLLTPALHAIIAPEATTWSYFVGWFWVWLVFAVIAFGAVWAVVARSTSLTDEVLAVVVRDSIPILVLSLPLWFVFVRLRRNRQSAKFAALRTFSRYIGPYRGTETIADSNTYFPDSYTLTLSSREIYRPITLDLDRKHEIKAVDKAKSKAWEMSGWGTVDFIRADHRVIGPVEGG